ncbi:MAG: phage tail protein [Clostridiaceae bacterium]
MTQTPLKIPGLKKYGNITPKQGLVDSMVLYEWMTAGLEGDVERKTLTITLLDIAGSPAASWQIINAWPVKIYSTGFQRDIL